MSVWGPETDVPKADIRDTDACASESPDTQAQPEVLALGPGRVAPPS